MTNVIRLDGRPDEDPRHVVETGIAALRLTTGMEPEEFSEALGRELGWPVPLMVYLQWEQAGGPRPPAPVIAAARRVSADNPIRSSARPTTTRRDFLSGIVGLSALALGGTSVGQRERRLAWSRSEATAGGGAPARRRRPI